MNNTDRIPLLWGTENRKNSKKMHRASTADCRRNESSGPLVYTGAPFLLRIYFEYNPAVVFRLGLALKLPSVIPSPDRTYSFIFADIRRAISGYRSATSVSS